MANLQTSLAEPDIASTIASFLTVSECGRLLRSTRSLYDGTGTGTVSLLLTSLNVGGCNATARSSAWLTWSGAKQQYIIEAMKATEAARTWLRTRNTPSNAPTDASSSPSSSSAVQAAALGGVNLSDAAAEIYRDVGRTFPTHPFFQRPTANANVSTTSHVSTVTAGGSISRRMDQGDNTQIDIREDTTPGLSMLLTVLLGFVCARPTVSYCQGMNYVAAILLISTPTKKHFTSSLLSPATGNGKGTNRFLYSVSPSSSSPISSASPTTVTATHNPTVYDELQCIRALALLLSLNDNYNLSDIWSPTLPRIKVLGYILSELTKRHAPLLHEHLDRLGMDIDILATQWLLPLFTTTIPLQTVVVVWDLFFAQGWKTLFRTAVTLLVAIEPYILTLDLGGVAMFLRTWKDVVGQCYSNHENEYTSSPLIQTLLEECPALSILFQPTKLLEAASRIKVTRRQLRELEDLYAHKLIENKAKAYVLLGASSSSSSSSANANSTVTASATSSSSTVANVNRTIGATPSQTSSESTHVTNSSPSSATTSPSITRSRAVSSFASPASTDIPSQPSASSHSVQSSNSTVSPSKPPLPPSTPSSSSAVTAAATNPSVDTYALRDILSRPLLVPMYVLMHEDTENTNNTASLSFSSPSHRYNDYPCTCTFSRLPSVAASKAARALRKAVVSATSKASKNHHHHHHLFLHDASHDGTASLRSSSPTSPRTPRSRTSTAASPFGSSHLGSSSTTLVNPSTRSLHSEVISPSGPLSLSTSSSSLALHSPRSRSASNVSSMNNPVSGSNTTTGGLYSSSRLSSRRNSFLHSVPTRNVLARSYSGSTKTDSYLDALENIVAASSSPLFARSERTSHPSPTNPTLGTNVPHTPGKESIVTFQDGHSYRLGIPTPRRTPYANRGTLPTPVSNTVTDEEKQKELILRIADDIYDEEIKPTRNDNKSDNRNSFVRNQRTLSSTGKSVQNHMHHTPSEISRILDEHGLLYVDLRVPNALLSAKPSLHLPGSLRRQRIGTSSISRGGQSSHEPSIGTGGNSLSTPVTNRSQSRLSSDDTIENSSNRFGSRITNMLREDGAVRPDPVMAAHVTTPSLTITDNTFTPSTVPFAQRFEGPSTLEETPSHSTVQDPSTNVAMLEYPLNCPSRIDTTVLFEDLVRTLAEDLEKINRSTRNDVSYLSAKITAARNAADAQAIVVRDSKAVLTLAENRTVETLDAKRALTAKLNEILTANSNPSATTMTTVENEPAVGNGKTTTTPGKGNAVVMRSPGTANRTVATKGSTTTSATNSSNEVTVMAAVKRYSSVLASLDEQVHDASNAWKRAVWAYTMEVTKLDELKGARDALMSSLVEVTTMGTLTKEALLNRTYRTLINLWKAQQMQEA